MITFVNFLLAISAKLGYGGIIFLMAVESSFIPFPSEIIIPPAAYLASQGEFNIYLVIIAGIAGSLIGAVINYFLALTLGRKIVYSLSNTKISKMLLITEKKIRKAEEYFLQYGAASTFLGRLVPAVRQLISIPAGFSRMNFKKFIFYTALGSGLWVTILGILGYFFGAQKELMEKFYTESKYIIMFLALAIFVFIILLNGKKNTRITDMHKKQDTRIQDTNKS
ncbi:DedA family protein [Candidatus Falkowbacteria bacterium]|nr:MAG: DedA family protein [Candidatus Falkowbacteria bacterium]